MWSIVYAFRMVIRSDIALLTIRLSIVFKVPTLAAGDPSAVSIWVGLDGLTTHHVIQAGVDAILTSDGEVSYTAWFEWYPNPLTYFEDFSIQKGDSKYFVKPL